MRNENNNDNLYPEGTVICAKADPALNLIISKYRQRIYYCAEVDDPKKILAYFENELIPPKVQSIAAEKKVDAINKYTIGPEFTVPKV